MARRVLFSKSKDTEAEAVEDYQGDEGAGEVEEAGDEALDMGPGSTEVESGGESESGGSEDSTQSAFSFRLRKQAVRCAEVTIDKLVKAQYLEPGDGEDIVESFVYYVDDLPEKSAILDVIAFLVWIKLETRDEKAVKDIRNLTLALSNYIPEKVTHCGFAHLNEIPEIYQERPRIVEICSTLMCPIVQSHEKDFVNVCSINPITASAAAMLVARELEKESGIKTFTSVITTDSSAWSYLCERHFES